MNTDSLEKDLIDLIKSHGFEAVAEVVREKAREYKNDCVCTIIVNEGIHQFPHHILNGDIYIFSRGSMSMDSQVSLESDLLFHINKLAKFLRSKKWVKVYIVISGHAVLCMQVKLAVYRVTRIESTDWVYDGNGRYIEVNIPMRKAIENK